MMIIQEVTVPNKKDIPFKSGKLETMLDNRSRDIEKKVDDIPQIRCAISQ
jgi:hypothetical protein